MFYCLFSEALYILFLKDVSPAICISQIKQDVIVCYRFQYRKKKLHFRKMVLEADLAIQHFHMKSNPECLFEINLLTLSGGKQRTRELGTKQGKLPFCFLKCYIFFFYFQLQISEEKILLFFKQKQIDSVLSFMVWSWVSYILGPQSASSSAK